ncbi:MAG: hypothetical protein WB622_07550 [Acidobacteriaceae bacterium]|jgi:hypothetical protein
MKLFTQETLNSVWDLPSSETAASYGVDMVDVPGDEAFSAHRESVSEVEDAITIHGQPQTYSDDHEGVAPDRYTRLRADPGAAWGLWARVNDSVLTE